MTDELIGFIRTADISGKMSFPDVNGKKYTDQNGNDWVVEGDTYHPINHCPVSYSRVKLDSRLASDLPAVSEAHATILGTIFFGPADDGNNIFAKTLDRDGGA